MAAVIKNNLALLVDEEVLILRVVVHVERLPVGLAAVQHGRFEVHIKPLLVALLDEAAAWRVVRGANEIHVRLLEKIHIDVVDRRLRNEALERVHEVAVGAAELHDLAVNDQVLFFIEADVSETNPLRVNRSWLAGRLARDLEAIQARVLGIPSLRRGDLRLPGDLRLVELAIGRGERDFLALGIEQAERSGRFRVGRFHLAGDGERGGFAVLRERRRDDGKFKKRLRPRLQRNAPDEPADRAEALAIKSDVLAEVGDFKRDPGVLPGSHHRGDVALPRRPATLMLGDEFSIHPNLREFVRTLKAEADFLSREVGGNRDLPHVGHRDVLLDRMSLAEHIARHRHRLPTLRLGELLPEPLRRGNLKMPGAIERNIGIPHPVEFLERRAVRENSESGELKKNERPAEAVPKAGKGEVDHKRFIIGTWDDHLGKRVPAAPSGAFLAPTVPEAIASVIKAISDSDNLAIQPIFFGARLFPFASFDAVFREGSGTRHFPFSQMARMTRMPLLLDFSFFHSHESDPFQSENKIPDAPIQTPFFSMPFCARSNPGRLLRVEC